jgi:hypothetical protein
MLRREPDVNRTGHRTGPPFAALPTAHAITLRVALYRASGFVLWPLSTFAVMQQFVRNWELTGIVINHLDTSLLTQQRHGHRNFAVMHNTIGPGRV